MCRLAKAPPKSLNLEISTSAKLLTWPYLRQLCQYRQEFPVLGRSDRLKRRSGRSAPSARRHRRNPKPPPPASQQPFGPGGWHSEGSIKTQWPEFIGNEDLDNDNIYIMYRNGRNCNLVRIKTSTRFVTSQYLPDLPIVTSSIYKPRPISNLTK